MGKAPIIIASVRGRDFISFYRTGEVGPLDARPSLRAVLHDALVLARGLDGDPSFVDVMAARLFDVDVFSCMTGMNHLQGVPMVGSGDDHRIKIFPVKKFSIVAELFGLVPDFCGSEFPIRLIQVTDCHRLTIFLFEETTQDLVASIAETDETHSQPFIRTKYASRTRGGHDGRRSGSNCRLGEISASKA